MLYYEHKAVKLYSGVVYQIGGFMAYNRQRSDIRKWKQ